MNKKLNVVTPNYLCFETLPYAADIFYHGKLVYYMPVGISPDEWDNVIRFPQYCVENDIALPQTIWEMTEKYFSCSKQAVECSNILEPLNEHILTIATVYARDTKAILRSRTKINEYPKLRESFGAGLGDLDFLSRELFSHVFLEVYIEGGFGLIKDYLEKNCSNFEKMYELLAAVMTNRMDSVFNQSNTNYIVYNHNWYPYLVEYLKYKDDETSEENTVDVSVHRLFSEITVPVFGKCDSYSKAKYIAHISDKEQDAILGLKAVCREIIGTSIFYKNEEVDLRDEKLKGLILEKVIEPLQYMMGKTKSDVIQIVKDFVLDSTVIGGILGAVQGLNGENLGLSATAGAVAAGMKYIANKAGNKKELPAKLLVDGLKKKKAGYLEYENLLRKISFEQIRR